MTGTRRLMGMLLPGMLFLGLVLAGCRPAPEAPAEERVQVAVYFGDAMAQFTVPEDRVIELRGRPLVVRVLEELVAGPRTPGLHATLPTGTRVLGATVEGGVARVDFSRELVDNHPGGSTGEFMTINAIVYTLTDLEGVEAVTILVDGTPLDTLAGHMDLLENLPRGGIRSAPVFVDLDRVAWLQDQVDRGQEVWRLDPVEVARRDGRMAGFRLADEFRLFGVEAGVALVEATHQGRVHFIRLRQPVRAGPGGVWVIDAIDMD
ncbi:MAG TPA: GerMN domain-containing protein [Bacillota bacterium]|nr:GerMN domain-containing protein [Bacillota bacterium]